MRERTARWSIPSRKKRRRRKPARIPMARAFDDEDDFLAIAVGCGPPEQGDTK